MIIFNGFNLLLATIFFKIYLSAHYKADDEQIETEMK